MQDTKTPPLNVSDPTSLTILLIEHNPCDAQIFRKLFADMTDEVSFRLIHINCLTLNTKRLTKYHFDAILLALPLAKNTETAELSKLRAILPNLPLILLVDKAHEALAHQEIQAGAMDYLLKENLQSGPVARTLLNRTIRYAIERSQMRRELQKFTQDLQKSEARLRTIIEKNADGIIIIDRQGNLRFVNPAAENLFGYRAAELIGEDFGFPVVAGETTELDVHHRDGSYAVVEMRVVEADWEGMKAYLASLRDITQRKQVEAALQRSAKRLEALTKIDHSILAAQSPQEIANAALEHLQLLLPCQQVSITMLDEEAKEAVILATNVPHRLAGEHLPLNEDSIFVRPQQGGKLKVTENSQTDVWSAEQLLMEGLCSVVSISLMFKEKKMGALTLGTKVANAFTTEDVQIAHEVADQLAIAVQQARLFEQIRAGRERLQILSRRLLEAQEIERRHIARELHDEIGQALTAVKISLQAVQRAPNTQTLLAQINEGIGIVNRALDQVRNLSLDLRPSLLDDLGLLAALRWLADRQSRWAGFTVEFHSDLATARLPPDLETACFRVAKEALTNIVRHAQAHRVQIEVRQHNGELHLIITDDGVGFNVRTAKEQATRGLSLGLLGMEERVLLAGGQIKIESQITGGARIWTRFPLQLKREEG